MASRFDSWSFMDAQRVIPKGTDMEENRLFYTGDHWQLGNGWTGPHVNAELEGGDEVMVEIKKQFVSSNKVKEIVDRHRDAIVGKPIMWHVAPRRFMKPDEKPTDAEAKSIREAEAVLTHWWDERGLMEKVQYAISKLLWAERAALRLFVPPEMLTDVKDAEGKVIARGVAADTLEEAILKIFPEDPDPRYAYMYTDPNSKESVAITIHNVTDKNGVVVRKIVELIYLDGDLTVYRTLEESGKSLRLAIDLNRMFTMAEVKREPFITEQVRQNQKGHNLALTMAGRNVITGGFLERTMLNAQMPGSWELDAQGNRVKFNPTEYHIGPNVTSWVQGANYKDPATGEQKVMDPSVVYREPIDPKPSFNAAQGYYMKMLEEVRQEHVLTNTEALMSGKSREQARAAFAASLRATKTSAETLISTIMMAALATAEWFTNQPGLYTKELRVIAVCHLDTGPAAADEREQDNAAVEKGIMSRDFAMERAGVTDVDAERARIMADPMQRLDFFKKQFDTLTSATSANIPIEIAAEMIGIEPAVVTKIKELIKKMEENQPQPDQPPVRRAS